VEYLSPDVPAALWAGIETVVQDALAGAMLR